jgi:hypothetical protein
MKFIILFIAFFSALLWFPVESNSQYRVSDFEGRWRWISGTGDTLVLILKQIPGQEKLTGYHSFSRGGSVLDNSIPETPNRTYDSATIYGQITDTVKGELQYVIQDHPRNSMYFGKIELLASNKSTALFYTTKTERPHLFYDADHPIPAGRTFPDNLILTRFNLQE